MKVFSQIATTLFGLLTGGILLIAAGLVPYWRALEPAEFTLSFGLSLPSVGGAMIVLTIVATASMLLVAGLAHWRNLPSKMWLTAGALATLMMLATVPIYFGAANSLLAAGTLSHEAITAELATWQQMHWFRTLVGILGLFCAVRAGYAA